MTRIAANVLMVPPLRGNATQSYKSWDMATPQSGVIAMASGRAATPCQAWFVGGRGQSLSGSRAERFVSADRVSHTAGRIEA
jgi:hypothetical protein